MSSSRMPALSHPLLVLASSALLLLGLACGSDEGGAPAADAVAGPESQPRTAPPSPSGPAPEAQVTESSLPHGFPSDVPVFPDSEPAGAIGLGKGPMLASFTTDAEPAAVVDYYGSELPRQGWSVDKKDADGGQLAASKGGRTAVVRVNSSANRTNIAIVLEGS